MTDEKPKKKRRARGSTFGTSRKMSSGRWQARYPDPSSTAQDGRSPAPETFPTKAEADAWLAQRRTEMSQGSWFSSTKGKQSLSTYAAKWLANGGTRGELKDSTRALYADLLRRHIDPTIGKRPIASIDPETVTEWYSKLGKELSKAAAAPRKNAKDTSPRKATGTTRQAQAYRLLRGIMSSAVRAGAVHQNPCLIPKAGSPKTKERPFMSVQVFGEVVAKMPEDMQPAFYLALGTHLRLGELSALTWADVDLDAGTILIDKQVTKDGKVTTTKTDDRSTLTLASEMVALLGEMQGETRTGPVLTRANGTPISRYALQRAWKKAREEAGHEEFRIHDMRHTGLTLLTATGAPRKLVMRQGRHSTSRAADIYQHIVEEKAEEVLGDYAKVLAAIRSGS
ncbi:site-specific integrase [Pseudoclavibacter sp. Z016]|uniref:tyrosine-type recombinase/integrase n=1 Tax=Pseudoclavibacter sp. Z016 TaxID=2080581 RepID=UPI000CE8C6DF|nr:site-specific integrase [Pseudoclavibacter sp. Z016]PPF73387.1 hypothetical protein C5B99_15555 [Pseudoclavibacter sp. Z016]